MAKTGRPPKPTALHRLHGTYERSRHERRLDASTQPQGELGIDPPVGLTPSQAEGWKYAIENAPKGVLKPIDRGILRVWVEAENRHATAMAMQAKLDANSELKLLIRTPQGLMPSPYNDILLKTSKTMLRCVQELGFSPAARARVKAPPPEKPAPADNPWEALRLIPGGRSQPQVLGAAGAGSKPDPTPAA